MRGRGDMRMRGGAGPSHADDQFRHDYRGGYGDRGMRGRGMRARGGYDMHYGGMHNSRDFNENGSDTPMGNGPPRGMRGGYNDMGGRGRGAPNNVDRDE